MLTAVLLLLSLQQALSYVSPSQSQALLKPPGTYTYPGGCPCANTSLCSMITTDRFPQELFVFQVPGEPVNNNQWRHFDWSRITSVALWEFASSDAELFCYAHSLGVRIFIPASLPTKVYAGQNVSAKEAWVEQMVASMQGYLADGVNFDTEDAIGPTDHVTRDGLTDIVKRTREALDKAGLKKALVTFDVGWSPGIDRRFYDYKGLADVCDFLVIMAYDMASYIFGACLATPNSPPPQVMQGILLWLSQVPANELVLALPWYGRSYKCANNTAPDARYCPMAKPIPWRDANCTDAEASAVDFANIPKQSTTGVQRDSLLENAWMNLEKEGSVTQIWFDDVQSLSIKYTMAHDYKLRGVGVWTANMLDYGPPPFNNTKLVPQATHDMWHAISTVPFGVSGVSSVIVV